MSEEIEQLRKRVADLEAAARLHRRLRDTMDFGILLANGRGLLIEVNRQTCDMTGYTADELAGRPAVDLIVPRERARFEQETRLALGGGSCHAGFTLHRKTGEEVQVEMRIRGIDGLDAPMMLALFEDVTVLGARDRQRFLEGPSAAVGMLCEGVAHQFNNLFARVLACAEDAEETEPCAEVAQDLRTIVGACDDARSITDRLLSYARRRPLWRSPVNVVNILEHTLQMLESELAGAGIEVSRHYESVPDMIVDNVQTGQVFSNVIRNAIDAMPRGGRLRVSVNPLGEQLVIRISDTGIGIDPDYLDRIFLPFVGTKGALSGSETPGMGLGLAVCQGIVASHGGDISVESTPGKGSTFTIRLPLVPPEGAGEAQSVGPRP